MYTSRISRRTDDGDRFGSQFVRVILRSNQEKEDVNDNDNGKLDIENKNFCGNYNRDVVIMFDYSGATRFALEQHKV